MKSRGRLGGTGGYNPFTGADVNIQRGEERSRRDQVFKRLGSGLYGGDTLGR